MGKKKRKQPKITLFPKRGAVLISLLQYYMLIDILEIEPSFTFQAAAEINLKAAKLGLIGNQPK